MGCMEIQKMALSFLKKIYGWLKAPPMDSNGGCQSYRKIFRRQKLFTLSGKKIKKHWAAFLQFLRLPHDIDVQFQKKQYTLRDNNEIERLSKLDSVICSRDFESFLKKHEIETFASSLSDHEPVQVRWTFQSK